MATAVALLCLAVPRASAAWPDAPLGVGTPGTVRLLFLDMPLLDARGVEDYELDVRWWMANDWSIPTALSRSGRTIEIRTDEQADGLCVALRLPWARLGASPRGEADRSFASRVSTTIEARLIEHWGGWSDAPIEAWHGLIASTNFQRQLYPSGTVNLTLREPGGNTLFALGSPHLSIGDISLRTQLRLLEGGVSLLDPDRSQWAIAIRADLKVPLGSLRQLGGSGGWDAGLGLAVSAEIASWLTGHAMVTGSAWSGLPDGFPLQPRRWHWSAEISLAARAWGLTFLLEDRLVSPLFEDGWDWVPENGATLNASATYASLRAHNQISWGVRRGGLTFWMSEDWTPGTNDASRVRWFYNSNAPDFVLGISYARKL